jgi:hypothetical protein
LRHTAPGLKMQSMSKQEEIQKIRRQVDMYFDRALSRQDQDQLLERVNTDDAYHRVFNQEKTMREHIKQKIHRPGVSPDLIQAIKENIRMT